MDLKTILTISLFASICVISANTQDSLVDANKLSERLVEVGDDVLGVKEIQVSGIIQRS